MIKYPGKVKDPATQQWFEEAAKKAGFEQIIPGVGKTNPMLGLNGPGPEGERCKHCKQFIRREYSKTYFKCLLRGVTRGPATDHKANWPACGKFEKA